MVERLDSVYSRAPASDVSSQVSIKCSQTQLLISVLLKGDSTGPSCRAV